ncbi:MAG: DUF202 domain-containing protein [Alphaproteobacteria bacterium]
MIKNFSDHSANERTFLAWVRASVAVMTPTRGPSNGWNCTRGRAAGPTLCWPS